MLKLFPLKLSTVQFFQICNTQLFILQIFSLTWSRYCYNDDCTKQDPLSQESFRKLASSLPYSKLHHSKLVCFITKELMDTENPPQVLPNGYVYSTKVPIIYFTGRYPLIGGNSVQDTIGCLMWVSLSTGIQTLIRHVVRDLTPLVLGSSTVSYVSACIF